MRFSLAILAALLLAGPAAAAGIASAEFPSLAFQQHPGAQLPLDVTLRSTDDKPVSLRSLFDGKPVLLDFEYDRCTTLCGVVLDQLTAALRRVPLQPGRDYRLIAIDIDPAATSREAADFAGHHGVNGPGMIVLTGDEATIRRLASAAGFPYRRDTASDQFAHPAGLVVATQAGVISRYLLGFDWRPLDLRLALTEAAQAKVAAPAAQLLLLCYCYDPQTGHYDLAIGRLLEITGALTLLALAALILASSRRRGGSAAA